MFKILEKGKPSPEEIRALYDIRVKEVHHYNSIIWAFPTAYAPILAAEFHYLKDFPPALFIASLFNLVLGFVFWRHTENKKAVLQAMRSVERSLYGVFNRDYFPSFVDAPLATPLMNVAVAVLALSFFSFSSISLVCWMAGITGNFEVLCDGFISK